MRRAARIALVLVVASAAGRAGLDAQEELWQRGNQLYQSGDFAAAVDAYRAVVDAGYESAALHYNLGNAYFKTGNLGRAILAYERALRLGPGDPDVRANLDLARSLTADAVEPLPRFWLLSVIDWWVDLLPRRLLLATVALAWLGLAAGLMARVLFRVPRSRAVAGWTSVAGGVLVVVFGVNLLVREAGLGRPERGVILEASVPVRSAPAVEDDLTIFEVHEGTRVRVDRRSGAWAEVVLDDGKVGWVPAEVFETI